MANDLTGEFDVVAQFSIPAVDRLLAAMHGIKRFPHSLSLRIDDRPPRPGHWWPTAIEIIDAAGDSVVDPRNISDLPPATTAGSRFDAVVNPAIVDLDLPPLVPSLLHGRAQLQLAPPTLEIADAATSRIKVRMFVRARYIPDPQTPALCEFATGNLVISTTVNQITSQVGRVIDIDLRGQSVEAVFEPAWSSHALTPQDRTAINRVINNTLRSSMQPSNTTLPAGVEAMAFKAIGGPVPAVAALLNLATPPGNPSSAQRVFLNGADFALGIGADALRAAFQPALDDILSTPIPPFEVSITGPNPTYTVILHSAETTLRPGRILLIIKGRATTPAWYAPNFNFTARQEFTLQPQGTTAELVVGPMTLDTSSWIANQFRGRALDRFRPIRDRALARSDAAGKVRRMLDTERMMGALLRSLLTPARPDNQPPPPALGATLGYTSSDIEPGGVVLRGALTVADWGSPHVEFQEITPATSGPTAGTIASGPQYSAFKSWIRGGVIDTFEWKRAFDPAPGFRDHNRFVKLPEQPGTIAAEGAFEPITPGHVIGYRPMCVTITGRRMTANGPIASQDVTASYCAFHWFPLLDVPLADVALAPMVALTRPGPDGCVEIVGHVPSVREDKARTPPNLVVHFGTAGSAGQLRRLTEAIATSGHADAPAAVVCILESAELSRTRYVDGVVYAQADDRWAKLWALNEAQRPFTAVIDATGKAAWHHRGDLDPAAVIDALRRGHRPRRFAGASTVLPGVRIGHAPPNFVFSHERGHDLTLRKLIGRPVVLRFARSGRTVNAPAESEGSVVLTIGDGHGSASYQDSAAYQHASAPSGINIPDPTRAIAKAYGVAVWPTTVYIDRQGIVRDVRHGLLDGATVKG